MGLQALYANTTGSNNTANGMQALYSNTTGYNNTANGCTAGQYIADGVTANQTSSNSVYEGFQAYPLANGDTNENVIGNTAIGHGSNTTTLGNASVTDTYLAGTVHGTSFTGNAANITATSNSTLTTLSALSLPFSQLSGNPTVAQLGSGGSNSYVLTDVSGTATWQAASGGGGISGMTSGQVAIAGSATTVTSSKALAGSGAGITTGPASGVTSGDVASFTGTGGQIADSGVAYTNIPLLNAANTFTENQQATGLTLNSVANVAAPTGAATNSGQSVPASTTNEAALTCIDSSGANTTLGTTSANVTTTGGSSYIVWSYTLPSGCTTGYIWMKNTGSFSYYSAASGSSFTQNAGATTYTAAASYPVGGAYPTANTTGILNAGTVAAGTATPTTIGSNGVLLNGVPALQAQTSLNNYYSGGAGNLTGTGNNNTANGYQALYTNTTGYQQHREWVCRRSTTNTTGSNNTANGFEALYSNTTGNNNTANGYQALFSNTTGYNNTANGFAGGTIHRGWRNRQSNQQQLSV